MIKNYWVATNDETGKTMIIVPIERAEDAFAAKKIANKHFKVKLDRLHCIAGIKKGSKVEGRDRLSDHANCWMVWR